MAFKPRLFVSLLNAMFDYQALIDKYYPSEQLELRDIYIKHATQVADLALELNEQCRLGLDPEEVRAAAMIHDIGIFATDAQGIHCHGTEPYLRHGLIGAELLRREGAPEEWALVAERHTGSGITAEDVIMLDLPLPVADYCPTTLLQKLICYADKFYSKSGSMTRKSLDRVRMSLACHGSDALARFDALHKLFIPR